MCVCYSYIDISRHVLCSPRNARVICNMYVDLCVYLDIYILEIHGFVRHGFVLSQETLWKMASAGCYAWKIRAAVRIPAVPVARKNGSVSCTDVELFSMVSIF